MRHIRLLASLLFAGLLLAAPAARAASTNLVVSQLYAGGGNSGAAYTNDFVELFNRGATAVDLAGWSIQYATATGTSWSTTALSGSIQPGRHYLVQLASAAAVGSALPTPDVTGTTNIAATGGKVALVRTATALTCGGSVGSCSAVASVEDLVGYGTATDFEGAGAAPAMTNTTADRRAASGCTDNDSNSADFATGTPAPLNSAAAVVSCGTSPPPPPASGAIADAGVEIDLQSALSISLDHPSLNFGSAVSGQTPAALSEHVTVASTNAAGYALSVHRTSFTPADLPLGLSATAPAGAVLGGLLTGGSLVSIPIPPATELLIGTTSAPSAAVGDVWSTNIGFTGPIPGGSIGKHTATVTFTVIGR
jgi:hypothetical protein